MENETTPKRQSTRSFKYKASNNTATIDNGCLETTFDRVDFCPYCGSIIVEKTAHKKLLKCENCEHCFTITN